LAPCRQPVMHSPHSVQPRRREIIAICKKAGALIVEDDIYGVLSGSVAERIREIGVRSALGASPAEIYGLILRQGMTLAAAGVLLGVGGAIFASRALVTLLFGVTTLDVVTYAGVIALLFAIAGIACWLPASRAARVDPAMTLRAD